MFRAFELVDVFDARWLIVLHLDFTPLWRYPLIDEALGFWVYFKYENHLPIGVFKVCGGINFVARLELDQRGVGVYAASTGNYGQSVAYAASFFGIAATIFVSVGANPVKVVSMCSLGADVVEYGRDFDEAREHCVEFAAQCGVRYIYSGDEPLLIVGVAIATLEMFERESEIEMIIVPVGGGSGAVGVCIVVKVIRPDIEVFGVQSDVAPAAYRAW